MSARRYTQAQVERIFAKAEASADESGVAPHARDSYLLGFVSASLGVTMAARAVAS